MELGRNEKYIIGLVIVKVKLKEKFFQLKVRSNIEI